MGRRYAHKRIKQYVIRYDMNVIVPGVPIVTTDDQRRAIRHELESMKANGAHRRELSLHACKRLFFDLGVRPSMATVRELTQTGSASDIPKDIDHFWERIRDASKARI